MKTRPDAKAQDIDDADLAPPLQHTGEQPFRRPPEEEPERVGEGELDIGARSDDVRSDTRHWEGEDDDVVESEGEDD